MILFYAAILQPFYQFEYKVKAKVDKVLNVLLNEELKKTND